MPNPISILNDVLGPVMRGPSSSHTAGPFFIGTLARGLLGGVPASATFVFDPGGSFAEVYHEQGSDRGFVAGLLGWSLTDERFPDVLAHAAGQGLQVDFRVEPLPGADHPNTVEIRLLSFPQRRHSDGAASRTGRRLRAVAQSIGGGAIVFTRVGDWPVQLTGDAHEVLLVLEARAGRGRRGLSQSVRACPIGGLEQSEAAVREILTQDGEAIGQPARQVRDGQVFLHVRRCSPLPDGARARLEATPGVRDLWTAPPVFFVQRGAPLFASGAEMVTLAEARGCSLGQIGLAYEAALLGLPEREVVAEMTRRFDVMQAAVHRGLEPDLPPMVLLHPSARQVYEAEAQGRVALGGIHTRAAARAMAALHVNASGGVVCAAPTAGAAGVVPGTVVTLAEEWGLTREQTALALFAASAAGLVIRARATFAAEVAGCQVEIGAAGAMAAAAVVEAAGGSARQAADAAAIALQNTMGSICDPVQGVVEIPCHTRNAVAASSAFVCADLIMGGYANPIPLDETVDAMYAVGHMLPRELKCTALGGLSLAPSGLALPRLR